MKIISPKRLLTNVFQTVRNGDIFANSSLDLPFARTKTLDPRVTFTRASSATFVDSSGVLRSAVTNLVLGSADFSATYTALTNVTVSADTTAAPNGSITADTVTGTSSSLNLKYLYKNYATNTTGAYTASIYLKTNTQSIVLLRLNDNTGNNGARQLINLSTGALSGSVVTEGTATGASSTISDVGNGWYRCTVTCTFNSAITSLQGPSVYHDGYATSTSTNSYFAWGAQLEQASTVGDYVPTTSTINSAPRFDHNPTTGESLGLLVEEARTNSIRNNTMVGAVAGTPGTAPTNWSYGQLSTLTTEIVGSGSDGGINYVDIRFTGTATTTALVYFESQTQIAATNAQTWASSCFVKRVAGSETNLSAFTTTLRMSSSVGTNLGFVVGTGFTLPAPSQSLIASRFSSSHTTTNALTAFVNAAVAFNSTGAIDITLRIGLPQLEQGAFATSAIPTTSATVTRAADVASITGSNFSSWYNQTEGTVLSDGRFNTVAGNTAVVSINDGTTNNRHSIRIGNTIVTSAGTAVASFLQTPALQAIAKYGYGYAANNFCQVLNSSNIAVNTSGAVPVSANTMDIGKVEVSQIYSNGTIKRLTYWPTRLANTVLQQITQP